MGDGEAEMKIGTWGWVKIDGEKVEFIYTNKPEEVSQLAATAPKETWENIYRVKKVPLKEEEEHTTAYAAFIRAVRDLNDEAAYFFNGHDATHEGMADALRLGEYDADSFIWEIGGMNEGFAGKISEWLEER